MFKKLLSALLCVQMICTMAAAQPISVIAAESPAASGGTAADAADAPATKATEDATEKATDATDAATPSFVPGEVIVMFAPGAVRDAGISLNTARKLDNVDEGFGETMEATGDARDAAGDAKSEAAILRDILGEDFVLMDSIAFGDDLSIALVRSDIYETADMIDLLSEDDRIASAEANYYKEPQSSDYTYSLDDVMNAYNYQANSPLAHNESGAGVTKRGDRTKAPLSTNAGSVHLTEEEKE